MGPYPQHSVAIRIDIAYIGVVKYRQGRAETQGRQLSGIGAQTQQSIFGPLTEAGVKALQGATGITVDGIVGPQTWQKIDSLGD